VLLEEGQSLRRVADGPRISVVVRDGLVFVEEGAVGVVGEVSAGADFDFESDGDVSEGVAFDPEGEVTACEAVGDGTALSALWTKLEVDEILSTVLASLLFFAARLPPTPPPTAPTTTIAIITVRNIQKVRGPRPQITRSGGGVGDDEFFSR
jgi:hypothetical protein